MWSSWLNCASSSAATGSSSSAEADCVNYLQLRGKDLVLTQAQMSAFDSGSLRVLQLLIWQRSVPAQTAKMISMYRLCSLACVGDRQTDRQTDGQTDRQTDTRWI